ncbi:FtsX-like permease family protein [Brachybacterium alimentarium]|uniref:FtsX-like permease family protein n=1 Tax=Brachybacterium alimentarium TaxID=47845 RepID=UPI003FD20629
MSRLALARLITAGNRSSRFRLLGVVAGVAVGVALFLLLFGASQGFGERSERSTWNQLISLDPNQLTADNADLSDSEVAASTATDHFHDELITVVSVAANETSTVDIPGSNRIPAPGEYLASPALNALIEQTPADQLGDRYGTSIGTISDSALEGPDSLVLVVGTTTEDLLASAQETEPVIVTEFTGYDYSSQVYRTVAIIGAIAVLVPVLLLIAIVTDLGSAQRAERFASLRLIGATPRQLAGIAAVETAVTTLLGALLGGGLYLLAIPLAARIELGSSRFFPHDLMVSPAAFVAIVAGTIAGATVVAWWRTRRADIGPLGASRERMERRPRVWALIPLFLGLALLGIAAWASDTDLPTDVLVIGGFVFTVLGLLWAGPLLTSWTARLASSSARDASQVIGFSHVIRHPRAAFRAVAGLVVAVFTVTVFAVAITAAAGVSDVVDGEDRLPTSVLFAPVSSSDAQGHGADAVRNLATTPGVTGTAISYFDPAQQADTPPMEHRMLLSSDDAASLDLQTREDSSFVSIQRSVIIGTQANAEVVSNADQQLLTPGYVFVTTDGDPASIERARTALLTSGVNLAGYPVTRGDVNTLNAAAMENQFASLAYTGILIAAALSAVSLGVSTLAAILNRQRVFGLLGLIGMPRNTLRRLISYETLLPVITVFTLSIGLGVFTSWSLISALTARDIDWPGGSYYIILAVCGMLVLTSIAVTIRAARSITSQSTTRFE